jgi:acid ceramidase
LPNKLIIKNIKLKKMKELIIDLSKPPDLRWSKLHNYREGFNALLNFFSGEILELVPKEYVAMLDMYAQSFLSTEHYSEIVSISEHMEMPLTNVLVGNLYYDALKIVLGCSSFAIANDGNPIHGRNLDWHSNDNDLSTHSLVTRYINGKNEYITIGWPGFTGCLSGMAIGKFSISLNSVWSNDPFTTAEPIVYLIRKTLEQAESFNQAVEWLTTTTIASDCLLLVCGTNANEMVVVERTPTKDKVRKAQNGKILVTNDYKLIESSFSMEVGQLGDTSCGRYNRIDELLNNKTILTPKAVHDILSDTDVRMGITMQQMYFNPKKGIYKLF